MCGRYILSSPAEVVADFCGLPDLPTLDARYNIAPTHEAPIVKRSQGVGRHAAFARWGLVPSWAKDPAVGNRAINARSESVRSRPSFRDSFRERRCLIPADGFYEWVKKGPVRQPYLFRPKDAPLLVFVGLWDHWAGPERSFDSFTILTTRANEVVSPIHDRMPVLLDRADQESWLHTDSADVEKLVSLLRPAAAEALESLPVSTYVNSPANDGAQCITRAQVPQALLDL